MSESGNLYIVATPIGNLADITYRAVDILKQCSVIACEDTRQSRKLLDHYEIKASLISFHDHSKDSKILQLMQRLEQGDDVAYISDCGTPLISDPGFVLVREAVQKGYSVTPIPGASAVIAALMGAGLPCERFVFEGFLPPKSGARKNRFLKLQDEERTLVFYESPHRILKSLKDALEVLGDRPACVARELTKKFEEFMRGSISEIITELEKRKKIGELVLMIEGNRKK